MSDPLDVIIVEEQYQRGMLCREENVRWTPQLQELLQPRLQLLQSELTELHADNKGILRFAMEEVLRYDRHAAETREGMRQLQVSQLAYVVMTDEMKERDEVVFEELSALSEFWLLRNSTSFFFGREAEEREALAVEAYDDSIVILKSYLSHHRCPSCMMYHSANHQVSLLELMGSRNVQEMIQQEVQRVHDDDILLVENIRRQMNELKVSYELVIQSLTQQLANTRQQLESVSVDYVDVSRKLQQANTERRTLEDHLLATVECIQEELAAIRENKGSEEMSNVHAEMEELVDLLHENVQLTNRSKLFSDQNVISSIAEIMGECYREAMQLFTSQRDEELWRFVHCAQQQHILQCEESHRMRAIIEASTGLLRHLADFGAEKSRIEELQHRELINTFFQVSQRPESKRFSDEAVFQSL